MSDLFVALTAHDPLSRFDTTLRVLKEYDSFAGYVEIEIFIDYDHIADLDEFQSRIDNEIKKAHVMTTVADGTYKGYELCWAHKPTFKDRIRSLAFDAYIYTESDMLLTQDNFDYWYDEKDGLKQKNLEPGFCRFERAGSMKIPFDNYRKWRVTGPTPSCWGNIPHNGQFYQTPYRVDQLGYFTLGNPYAGLMILDQEDANVYTRSPASDPQKSYPLTGKRNWPIADRSSMGLAFHNLLPGQEHRRVVPIVATEEALVVPDHALVEHLDKKYSPALIDEGNIITTESMISRA